MTCLSDDSLLCWERATFRLLYRLTVPATPRRQHLRLATFAATDAGTYLLAAGQARVG